MKKYLQRNITFFIGFILIVALITMAYFCFNANKNQANGNLELNDNDLTNTSYVEETTENPYNTYTRSMPKASNPSINYIFEQTIEGNGNIYLKNYFTTYLGNYIIAESTCKNGDIQGDYRTIGISRIDNLGKIDAVFEIPSTYDNYYMASQTTNSGIVIATTNKEHSYIYINIVDYSLSTYTTHIISYAEKITIRATSTSFLLLAEYSDENIIYSYKNEKLVFSGNTSGQLVDIFEFGNYYLFLLNKPNGWVSAQIDKTTLQTKSTCLTSGYKLIGIIPIMEDEQAKYIILQTNGTVYAQKESNLLCKDSTPTKIGQFEVSNFMLNENKLIMVCKGKLNGIVYLNYDLTCEYGDNNSEYFINEIYDYNTINNTYYYISKNGNDDLSLLTYKNNQTTQLNLGTCNDSAHLLLLPNKTAQVAYQTTNEYHTYINIVGISI